MNEPASGGGGGNHAADCMKLCAEGMMLSGVGIAGGIGAWKFGMGAGWGAAAGLAGGGAAGGLFAGAILGALAFGSLVFLMTGFMLVLECQRKCGVGQITDSMLPPGRR